MGTAACTGSSTVPQAGHQTAVVVQVDVVAGRRHHSTEARTSYRTQRVEGSSAARHGRAMNTAQTPRQYNSRHTK